MIAADDSRADEVVAGGDDLRDAHRSALAFQDLFDGLLCVHVTPSLGERPMRSHHVGALRRVVTPDNDPDGHSQRVPSTALSETWPG
jgi:hypothetical protein